MDFESSFQDNNSSELQPNSEIPVILLNFEIKETS